MSLLPDNFHFDQPHWFWALLILPVLAMLKWAAGRQSVVQFGSLELLKQLGRRTSQALGPFGLALTFITITAAVFALARPQKVTTEDKIEESGVEIFLALDLSYSMSIKDMFYEEEGRRTKVDRLTVAKNVTRKFIEGRPTDRIGFVVFSGKPFVASPLTLDANWLMETLEKDINFNTFDLDRGSGRVQTDTMGTAIGSAIASAASRLSKRRDAGKGKKEEPSSRVIILITDGANNSGRLQPSVAAAEAAKLGIRIYTVAIGTYGHHEVPELVQRGMFGDVVRQEFDEKTLKEVAATTNGRFYHARDATAMSNIMAEIDRLEKKQLNIRRSTTVDELYSWPLWAAVGSAVMTLLLHQTLLRRYP